MSLTPQDRMMRSYQAAGGRNVGAIPWETIISLLMDLFGGCTAKRAKRFSRMFPEATKRMMADKLKDDAAALASRDRTAIVEAAHDTVLKISERELEDLIG